MADSELTKQLMDTVKKVAAKIQEYPSTPYTSESADTLKTLLESLEISRRMDRNG